MLHCGVALAVIRILHCGTELTVISILRCFNFTLSSCSLSGSLISTPCECSLSGINESGAKKDKEKEKEGKTRHTCASMD